MPITKPAIQSFAKASLSEYKHWRKKYSDFAVFEYYKQLYIDYHCVTSPELYFLNADKKTAATEKLYTEHISNSGLEESQLGYWVALPALQEIYHLIAPEDYLLLRTIRNRELVTKQEQLELSSKKIALIGLSVGGSVAVNLVRMGVGNHFTLVDYDVVDSHNLNRTQFFLRDLHHLKNEKLAAILWGIDPFLTINQHSEAIAPQTTLDLIQDHHLVIDAFDHFEAKISLRQAARQLKIPVISGWDVGSGMVIIVERYDRSDSLELSLFLNNVPLDEVLVPTRSLREKIDIFIKIIGKETHDERMLSSVYSIGTHLTGIPQTIIATTLTSSVFTQVAIDILLGKETGSFRKYLDLKALIYS